MTVHSVAVDEMPSTREFLELSVGTGSRLLLAVVSLAFVGFAFWVLTGSLDESRVAAGVIRPSREIGQVTATISAAVVERLIEHGSVVEAGQLLWTLDDAGAARSLLRIEALSAESSSRVESLTLAIDAVEAGEVVVSAPLLTRHLVDVFRSDARRLEVAERAAHRELAIQRGMPIAARVENEAAAAQERWELARIARDSHKARAVMQLIADLQAETDRLESLRREADTAADAVERAHIRAPVRGTVELIRSAIPGEFVVSGERLALIVPDQTGARRIEAEIPADRLHGVEIGQRIVVRGQANGASGVGRARGRVTYVGKESYLNRSGQRVFLLLGTIDTTSISANAERLALVSGMDVEVRVIVGSIPAYAAVLRAIGVELR